MGDNMTKIDEVKNRIKNKKNNTEEKSNSKFKEFLLKFFIVVVVFFLGTIAVRKDNNIKQAIYKNIYNNNFSFAKFKSIYNQYIGNIIPFQNIFNEKKVFSEKLEYLSSSKYNKGVKLKLSDNYAIPIIKGGIVIFVGEKENIGQTVIIQQSDGIDVWYGNLSSVNMKLYDYVSDNAIVGSAKNNELYLVSKSFIEDGYKKVLK